MSKHWFLPKDPDLLGLLCEQATITVDGMHTLVAWASGEPTAADDVRRYEHQADDKKRQLWRELRERVLPADRRGRPLLPLVRSRRSPQRGQEPRPRTRSDETHARRSHARDDPAAGRSYAASRRRLRATGQGRGRCHRVADAGIKSARRVEHVYRSAMSALLGVDDLREVMGRREVYRRLSRMGDHIHTVADRIWYAVMKEA